MNKKTSSFERYINYTLYIVIVIFAIIVIVSPFDTIIRFTPDSEIIDSGYEVYGGLLTFGSILAIISIILVVNSLLKSYKFASLNQEKTPATSASMMFDSLDFSLVSIPFTITSWVLISIYLVVNGFPIPFLWAIPIPILLIFLSGLVLLLGFLRAKLYSLSFTEYRRIGREKLRDDQKKEEAKRKRVKREKEKRKKEKLLRAKKKTTQTTRPRVSISSQRVPSQSKRFDQLNQIVRRTKQMRLTDLRSLLEFKDKPSLMNWLYSLSDNWKFTIKGDFITFETTDDDKKETKTEKTEKIKEQKRKLQCLYCEAILVEVEDEGPIVCLNCGKKAPYCEICKNIIVEGEKIVQTKPCNHIFHKNHILEWIKVKGTCPICKEPINEESLRPFIPE